MYQEDSTSAIVAQALLHSKQGWTITWSIVARLLQNSISLSSAINTVCYTKYSEWEYMDETKKVLLWDVVVSIGNFSRIRILW